MSVVEHLEGHLGLIDQGWKDQTAPGNVRVVCFKDRPFKNIVTYSTLGLSHFELPMRDGRYIREELIFTAYRNFNGAHISSFLTTFAEYIIHRNKALLSGEFIGPATPIIWGTLLNSIYSTVPMIYEETFSVYDGIKPPVVFVWLIPIHEEEANYIRFNGWDKFEKLLEKKDPELWDLARASIIEPQDRQ
jgi:Suppressor of fused protein (SUFU)